MVWFRDHGSLAGHAAKSSGRAHNAGWGGSRFEPLGSRESVWCGFDQWLSRGMQQFIPNTQHTPHIIDSRGHKALARLTLLSCLDHGQIHRSDIKGSYVGARPAGRLQHKNWPVVHIPHTPHTSSTHVDTKHSLGLTLWGPKITQTIQLL